jgi:hypothetical protein
MIESPTRPLPSGPGLRARLGAIAALAAVLIGLGAAPAATAVLRAETTPSPTPTAPPLEGDAEFTLAPISNGVLRPGEVLTVSVTMTNDTFTATSEGSVALEVGFTPFSDRDDLASWLAGEGTANLAGLASVAFPAVEAGDDETRGIMAGDGDPRFAGLAPGVYPLAATLTTAEGSFTSTSAVVVPDDPTAPVGVGVVVPVTAPATAAGLLTADELVELTGPEGSLTNILDAVEGTAAILAVDPAIPAAIRVLGSSAPPTVLLWLARLEALPQTRFALQFGDADVAAQVQAGIVPPLRPTSLQAYLAPDDFITEDAPEPTPSASPSVDPAAPVFPDTETLLSIGQARAGVFWPGTGSAGTDVVTALGGLTVEDQRGLTLVPSETTTAGAEGGTVPARGDLGEAPVLVYDSAISDELLAASSLDVAALRGAHLAAATAHLSFALAETGGAPLLVTVDRADERSRVALRTAITAALETPSATPAALGTLANTAAQPVGIVDVAPDEARVAAASALIADEAALADFASILDDPGALRQPERAEILQLLGEAWRPEPVEWAAALATHRAESAQTLDSVGIIRASPIQLITTGAVIPVWVRNDLPYPANVTLFATPDDLRLRVQQTTSIVAQPDSNTRIEVPVQAQLGSGDVTIDLALRSPTGVLIGDPQTREVHVRAEWEAIGLVIIGVFGVGFVLVGVIRTIQRRRRRAADAEAGVPVPGGAAATGGGAAGGGGAAAPTGGGAAAPTDPEEPTR